MEPKITYLFKDFAVDAGGAIEATADYSATPTIFRMTPSQDVAITDLIVGIDAGGAPLGDGYGNLPALTNGILGGVFEVESGVELYPLILAIFPVVTTCGWGQYIGDVGPGFTFSVNTQCILLDWEFQFPIVLRGGEQEVRLILNDDFTGLAGHRFLLKGKLV